MYVDEWWKLPWQSWRNKDDGGKYQEREFQQYPSYNAEDSCRGRLGKRFEGGILEAQAFIDGIMSSDWRKERWEHKGVVHVRAPKHESPRVSYSAYGSYYQSRIILPKWAQTEIVAIHELAHVLTHPRTGGGHGRFWACTFLELTRHVLGEQAFFHLRQAFDVHKIKYWPKTHDVEARAAAEPPLRNPAKRNWGKAVKTKDRHGRVFMTWQDEFQNKIIRSAHMCGVRYMLVPIDKDAIWLKAKSTDTCFGEAEEHL